MFRLRLAQQMQRHLLLHHLPDLEKIQENLLLHSRPLLHCESEPIHFLQEQGFELPHRDKAPQFYCLQ